MKTINERLHYFLKFSNLPQVEVAEKLNISTSRLANWVAKSSIPMYNLTEILELFQNLNARWLLTGQGEMLNGGVNIPELLEEPKAAYKNNCCELCKEKDKQIDELIKDKEWLKAQIEAKKETGAANSVQFRQAANE
jgi:transcriptional regulator with XRE-family HTH domain